MISPLNGRFNLCLILLSLSKGHCDLAQTAYRRAVLICCRYRHDCFRVEKVCAAQEVQALMT